MKIINPAYPLFRPLNNKYNLYNEIRHKEKKYLPIDIIIGIVFNIIFGITFLITCIIFGIIIVGIIIPYTTLYDISKRIYDNYIKKNPVQVDIIEIIEPKEVEVEIIINE